jgi:hypothetical protein
LYDIESINAIGTSGNDVTEEILKIADKEATPGNAKFPEQSCIEKKMEFVVVAV